MLCTRMRLVERRYSMTRETPDGVSNSAAVTLPGFSSSSSTRIVQRPCIIRNLSNNCDGSVVSSATSVATMTPRQVIDQSLMKRNSRRTTKPQLVVFSLGIQPGTKTLAQNDIKRDPRKLPTFCENYKQITKQLRKSSSSSFSSSSLSLKDEFNGKHNIDDLCVRGVEIFNEKQKSNSTNCRNNNNCNNDDDDLNETNSNNCSIYVPNELKIQLTDCCQCIRDIYASKNYYENMQILSTTIPNTNDTHSINDGSNYRNNNNNYSDNTNDYCNTEVESELRSNFLTIKGHSSNSLMNKTGMWIDEHYTKLNASPRTKQIINIKVNNKKE